MRDAVHATALCTFSQYLVAGIPLPPLLVLQGTADDSVTPDMAQRLVASYRAAGGGADLETFETQPHTFTTKDQNIPVS
jgi:acetyl esterase